MTPQDAPKPGERWRHKVSQYTVDVATAQRNGWVCAAFTENDGRTPDDGGWWPLDRFYAEWERVS